MTNPVHSNSGQPVEVVKTEKEDKEKKAQPFQRYQAYIAKISSYTVVAAIISGIGAATLLFTSENGWLNRSGKKLAKVYVVLEALAIMAIVSLVAIKVIPRILA